MDTIENKKGLYAKYKVSRTDTGKEVEGFVLCPEKDLDARKAMLLYARLIGRAQPALAEGLRDWVKRVSRTIIICENREQFRQYRREPDLNLRHDMSNVIMFVGVLDLYKVYGLPEGTELVYLGARTNTIDKKQGLVEIYQYAKSHGFLFSTDEQRDQMWDKVKWCQVSIRDLQLEGLWEDLGDIPVEHGPDSVPRLDEDFHDWPKGTELDTVWHWFDEEHSKGLAFLMHRKG